MSELGLTLQGVFLILYPLTVAVTILVIVLDTHSTPKTFAYILLVLFLPLVGMLVYFSFGINYRHLRAIFRQQNVQAHLDKKFPDQVENRTDQLLKSHVEDMQGYEELVIFLHNLGGEYLSKNEFKLLINGEEKFPEILLALESAEKFIHMEYYAWENDRRGNEIKEVLLRKVREGVRVRVLYDDYGSRKIRRNIVRELKAAGVEIFPKIKLRLAYLANRLNHRDHRKVIIVDGHTGFVGGINLSDRYDNSIDTGLYWRDTHIKFTGPIVANLQRHFIVSWNSGQPEQLEVNPDLFPGSSGKPFNGITGLGQLVAGGPIYPNPNIMLSYFRIFTLATKKLYITNPYFIPSDSILDALKQAAISGVDVRLLLPEKSDSRIVAAASKFFFGELLRAGVRIFLYRKGFIHAKAVVSDGCVSVVGSANMDIRSFDLNFEIMAVIYGREFAMGMENVFLEDLNNAREVSITTWRRTGFLRRLKYAVARLVSELL